MNLQSYKDFIYESEKVNLDKDLKEYTLVHVKEDRFQLKSDDFYKDFTVLPYKSETLDDLKDVQYNLDKAIESLNIEEIYDKIVKAELIPYSYGNVFPIKYNLKNISSLSISIDNEQKKQLEDSEKLFLSNSFSSLNREIKTEILHSLKERAEVLCAIIEALFYYIRLVDKDNFYNGLDRDEIIEVYNKQIDDVKKEGVFSCEGPFKDLNRDPVSDEDDEAVWICEKDSKKFIIRSTISPNMLYSQNKTNPSFKFSLEFFDENRQVDDNFKLFNIEELSSRVNAFNKILQKI